MNLEEITKKVFTENNGRINTKVNKLTTNCIDSENNTFNLDCEGNLSVNSITTKIESAHKIYFPVGTLYWNDNDISNIIAEQFEGTWERVEDVFILAAGKQFRAGINGGEATHTLTTQEMPRHFHNYGYTIKTFYGTGEGINTIQNAYMGGDCPENYIWEQSAGDSLPHNNMPPYHTSYCWKRVA